MSEAKILAAIKTKMTKKKARYKIPYQTLAVWPSSKFGAAMNGCENGISQINIFMPGEREETSRNMVRIYGIKTRIIKGATTPYAAFASSANKPKIMAMDRAAKIPKKSDSPKSR